MSVLIEADEAYWTEVLLRMTNQSRNGLSWARTTQLLRYHRPAQFAWRLMRLVQQRTQRTLPNLFTVPETLSAQLNPDRISGLVSIADQRCKLWPHRHQAVAEMTEGVFCALNRCVDLSDQRGGINWDPTESRLWRFHLQSQEALLQLADETNPAAAFRWIESWLSFPKHRQPGMDPDAWHPFCLSRRLPVWLGLAAQHGIPQQIASAFSVALARQLHSLRRHLEWDLGGNHLLENLTALYLGEVYLRFDRPSDLPQIERWLMQQCELQVLESGEHVERAPTYHALMTVSLLQCVQAAKDAGRAASFPLAKVAARMVGFLKDVQQPNGELALLGDSGTDELPDLDRLLNWAKAVLPVDDQDAKDSVTRHRALTVDYGVFRRGSDHQLLFDSGALACDHLPAHGHADLLNVTACLHGATALVDTGNFEYESTAKRRYCRSTAAHNVLQIDQREQADVFGSFRMGRRGRVLARNKGTVTCHDRRRSYRWASAIHDGFGAPVGRCVLETDQGWLIADWCGKIGEAKFATSRLHWHPDWELQNTEPNRFTAEHQHGNVVIQWLGAQTQAEIMPSVYCPGFGQAYQNQTLVGRTPLSAQHWIAVHLNLQSADASHSPAVSASQGRICLQIAEGPALELCEKTGTQFG